jgi:hypothetical protein
MIKPKALIFIDHDIMIRHFIHNHSFDDLEREYNVEYIFPKELDKKRITTDVHQLGLKKIRLIEFDRKRTGALRQLCRLQLMWKSRWDNSYSYGDQEFKCNFKDKLYKKMRKQSRLWYFPWYKWKVKQECGISQYLTSLIDEVEPDVLIHPTVMNGVFIDDLTLISKKKNIPFVCIMNSWDNVVARSMAMGLPDWLCVWGENSKQSAVSILKMNPERVKILGAAQFEAYHLSVRKSRTEICEQISVAPSKKLILYVGGNGLFLNEINHLKLIEELVENGKIQNAHVLYRPHPWRGAAPDEDDFNDLNWNHITMDPTMKGSYISNKRLIEARMNREDLITLTDYRDTHDILSAIDATIGTTSTIILESAIHGKPIVNFIRKDDLENNPRINLFYKAAPFFNRFMELTKTPLCHTKDELIEGLNKVLDPNNENYKPDNLIKISRQFAHDTQGRYGATLVEFLNNDVLLKNLNPHCEKNINDKKDVLNPGMIDAVSE